MFVPHHMHHELAHSLGKWEFDSASDQTFNVTWTEHNIEATGMGLGSYYANRYPSLIHSSLIIGS